jgi:hypothetical protein
MQERMEGRLRELRAEYETGQQMLSELHEQQANLERTLLRISGAIQVLEELGGAEGGTGADAPAPDAARTEHEDAAADRRPRVPAPTGNGVDGALAAADRSLG